MMEVSIQEIEAMLREAEIAGFAAAKEFLSSFSASDDEARALAESILADE